MSESSLRRVVSQSEEDGLLQEQGRHLVRGGDDPEGDNNFGAPTNGGDEERQFISSSAMGTPSLVAAAARDNQGATASSAPTSAAVWIEPSSSAQALQLAEGSVLYVPNRNVDPLSNLHDRDISSSSLSDDAEDDDDDDNRDGNRGGLLRFVTALASGSRNNNINNAAATNNNSEVPRSQPTRGQLQQRSAAVLNEAAAAAAQNEDEEMASSAEDESTMERTGSQNSSKDWGWWDDEVAAGDIGLLNKNNAKDSAVVAATTGDATASSHPDGANAVANANANDAGQPNLKDPPQRSKDSKQQKPPKKKRGLVPQVSSGLQDYAPAVKTQDTSDAAAAMAVTAPNYVLEESLSSQRLWKETAGQRPPQPAEERAFYEKMWAQNFAKSNVEYGMPVEVLTATSPISLSPYFDAHYAASDPDPSHHHHPHDGDYAAASGGGDAVTAVAEAALKVPPTSGRTGGATGAAPGRIGGGGNTQPGPSTILSNNQMLVNRTVHHADGSDLIVLVKGDNVFGTTVSKSFVRGPPGLSTSGVDTVNISIASYRVVEARARNSTSTSSSSAAAGASPSPGGGGGGRYAQFLVIYREGSIRDTIGVWKRYSDFEELARKVTQSHEGCKFAIANLSPLSVTEESETEHLPNAITSWRLLKKRQRWYRCLDAGYLSLKVFLLERFLHDILFESSSPKLLRDFVGADTLS